MTMFYYPIRQESPHFENDEPIFYDDESNYEWQVTAVRIIL
jgi:hypothetical protein